MLQLIYVSTARAPIGPSGLAAILETSRRNNSRDDITGLLVAGGRRFLQALEGPEAAVMGAFERIKADPRHFALVALSIRQSKSRAFGGWSMGYEAGGEASADASLSTTVEHLTAALADRNLQAHFRSFAALHARAA